MLCYRAYFDSYPANADISDIAHIFMRGCAHNYPRSYLKTCTCISKPAESHCGKSLSMAFYLHLHTLIYIPLHIFMHVASCYMYKARCLKRSVCLLLLLFLVILGLTAFCPSRLLGILFDVIPVTPRRAAPFSMGEPVSFADILRLLHFPFQVDVTTSFIMSPTCNAIISLSVGNQIMYNIAC